MSWTAVVGKILGGSVEVVTDYLTKRAELKSRERIRREELKDADHQRQVELRKAGLAADATWELEQIKNSSWKDEYVLIVLSIPLIGCFIPRLAPYVLDGFKILAQTPQWYQWLIALIFTAIYGIRLWRRQQYDTE